MIVHRPPQEPLMKVTTQAESNFGNRDWHDETTVLHGDAALATDSAVAAPIHYSATFRADTADEFAQMATASRPREFYTRYGNRCWDWCRRAIMSSHSNVIT